MRCLLVLVLLLGVATAQGKPTVAQVVDAHARSLGAAAGSVRSLTATFDAFEGKAQVKGVQANWQLPGRLCRAFPTGREWHGPEGVFLERGRIYERFRPGQLTTRSRYYYMRGLADPFPLLRYAGQPAAQRALRLGNAVVKGVRHPVLFTLPDTHGVHEVYVLDPTTFLIKNIRFEQKANKPFAQITLDDYREVAGVMLPHAIYSYQWAHFENHRAKRVTRLKTAATRFEQITRWQVNGGVKKAALVPPGAGNAQGDGFQRTRLRTGQDPLDVGVGDLDRDGRTDIAVACWGGLFVHFGGAAQEPVFVALGTGHHAGLAIDDLDGDGRPEVVTTSNVEPGQIFFMVSFDAGRKPTIRKQFGAPLFARTVVLPDLDHDGIPDFVAVGHVSKDLQIKFGNAAGGVRLNGIGWPLDTGKTGARGYGVAVGDINGDPQRDIAVVDGNRLVIFEGDVNLSFQPRMKALRLRRPVAVVMADLDHDGRDDLLAVNDDPREALAQDLAVILNRDGKLTVVKNIALGRRIQAVATGDLNGDSHTDAVTAAFLDGEIAVLAGDGKGAFAPPVKYASGRGTCRLAVADVTGDGRDDIVAVNRLDDSIVVFANEGKFAPRRRRKPLRAVECPAPVRVDFRLDGLSDQYEFAGEFRLPPGLRDPSGITVLGGDGAHAQLMLVSDKRSAFYRAVLDRTGGRLVVGPPVPLRGLEKEQLDLEGVVYDRFSGNVFLACEKDSSVVRATIFGDVLGRAPSGIPAGDNDGIEGIALRRRRDGTPLLYLVKERMGKTLKQPYIRLFDIAENPFALTQRGELRLPFLAADQTGATIDGQRMLVVSRFVRGIAEMEFKDDDFAPGAKKAVFSRLTDRLLELDNPKGRLFGVIEGIATGPSGDLYLVADHNGGVMGKEGLNRAAAGRLLWFRRIGRRPASRRPARVAFKQILVPFKGAPNAPLGVTWSREEALKKAQQLLTRARAGEDFETLLKESVTFSATTPHVRAVFDGHKPLKGEFKRTDLPMALARMAFALEVGEIGLVEWHEKEAPRGYRVVLRVE